MDGDEKSTPRSHDCDDPGWFRAGGHGVELDDARRSDVSKAVDQVMVTVSGPYASDPHRRLNGPPCCAFSIGMHERCSAASFPVVIRENGELDPLWQAGKEGMDGNQADHCSGRTTMRGTDAEWCSLQELEHDERPMPDACRKVVIRHPFTPLPPWLLLEERPVPRDVSPRSSG